MLEVMVSGEEAILEQELVVCVRERRICGMKSECPGVTKYVLDGVLRTVGTPTGLVIINQCGNGSCQRSR
jgi:hypothetical protein